MAITTVNGIVAGFSLPQAFLKITGTMEAAGIMHSLWYSAGIPGAASAPAAGLNGETCTSATAGAIPYTNAASGNKHLARIEVAAGVAGTLLVADRLWQNSGLVSATTTAQAIGAPVALPARDLNGASEGAGVIFGLEARVATTNAGAITNTTCVYRDSGDASPNTGTIASFPATAAAGTFVPFQLAGGDLGMKSVSSVTLGTSYGTGTLHLVAYRPLAFLQVGAAGVGNAADAIQLALPKLYDDTCLQLFWIPSATTTTTVSGMIKYTEG